MGPSAAAAPTGAAALRTVFVLALDDSLIRALAEQRPEKFGWRFVPLRPDITPDPDSLAIIDLTADETRQEAVGILRGRGFEGPVLLIGGQGRLSGLDDEPFPRPVRLGALLARIEAHWAPPPEAAWRLGPYAFAPSERMLRLPGSASVIRLTELERKLLAFLADAGGEPVDRERLLNAVWGYAPGIDTHTVETHIWRLRQKIETDDPATHFLMTDLRGYRLDVAQTAEDA